MNLASHHPEGGSQSNVQSPKDQKRLKAQIDALLENDFAVLSRHSDISQESLMTSHNNPLILHYVQHIYQEYNLPDPLPKKYSSKVSQTQDKTSTKKIKLTSIKDEFSTPPRENPLFKYKGSNKHLSPEYQTVPTKVTQFSPDRQISSQVTVRMGDLSGKGTIRTGSRYLSDVKPVPGAQERHFLEYQRKQSPQSYIREQLPASSSRVHLQSKQSHNFPQKHLSKITFNTSPQQKYTGSSESTPIASLNRSDNHFVAPSPLPQIISSAIPHQQEVKESFRYCIGCDRALLEANITSHEQKCTQFQQVLHMPMEDIVSYLKRKISRFEANIQSYSLDILKVDPQQMGEHSQKLLEESRQVMGSGQFNRGYEQEYDETVSMSSKWCRIAEEINKVNWFLKIRSRLKQSLSI